jgi:multidrug transporter EmrE-like cation transporter
MRIAFQTGSGMARDLAMIVFVTCSTLGSQLLIKRAVLEVGARLPPLRGADWLAAALTAPLVWLAVAIQGVGFVVWMVVVSRVKLGVAFATSGAFFYILLALVSWLLYGEKLAVGQWLGILLISAGVLVMTLLGRPA